MSRAKTSLQIDGIEYAIGDKVLVNPEISSGSQERIETVLRKINICKDCISLWFSKNNFASSKFTDKNYDVIVHFLWYRDLGCYDNNGGVDNLNIEHIKEGENYE